MEKVIIAGVTMPRTRALTVGGAPVVKEAQMADGAIVRDVIGWRTVVTADWDWIPADTLAAVVAAARTCGALTMSYPAPDGGDASGQFFVTIGSQKIFKFVDGRPMWHGVSLTATAREVST